MKREQMLTGWVQCREEGLTLVEAAMRIGTTYAALDRALSRARVAGDPRAEGLGVARPMTGPDDPRHGTATGYNDQKCRCDCCRAGNRERMRQLKAELTARGLADDDPRHGKVGTYSNWGCRCERCSDAHAAKMHAAYASRKRRGLPDDDPRHGTPSAYTGWACRCTDCRAAYRAYTLRRSA